ncbi:hypothetical protein A2U01_0086916, partial [Trifolium medium]|nr:hypothetical protein [Trifolium medium]
KNVKDKHTGVGQNLLDGFKSGGLGGGRGGVVVNGVICFSGDDCKSGGFGGGGGFGDGVVNRCKPLSGGFDGGGVGGAKTSSNTD